MTRTTRDLSAALDRAAAAHAAVKAAGLSGADAVTATREVAVNAASAKLDAKIATQTAPQLVTLWRLMRNMNTAEAAIVRGRIYCRLCVLVGDDAADAACE